MNAPIISLIVAMSRNRVIGVDGDLPWRLRSDLRQFKSVTMHKPMIMGRKTFESLPGLLPGRPHIILSRDKSYKAKGAEVFHSMKECIGRACELAGLSGQRDVMVVGGGQIYELALPFADRIYLTCVDAAIEGDTMFPALSKDWRVVSETDHAAEAGDDHDFKIQILERV